MQRIDHVRAISRSQFVVYEFISIIDIGQMKIKLVHDKCNHNREEKYFVQQNREDQA